MSKNVKSAELRPAVTTGPLASSRKIFVTPDEAPDVRVPLREIMLSEGAGEPNLPVYDTSGPYTDPDVTIDVNAGLTRGRISWVKERGGVVVTTLGAPQGGLEGRPGGFGACTSGQRGTKNAGYYVRDRCRLCRCLRWSPNLA